MKSEKSLFGLCGLMIGIITGGLAVACWYQPREKHLQSEYDVVLNQAKTYFNHAAAYTAEVNALREMLVDATGQEFPPVRFDPTIR